VTSQFWKLSPWSPTQISLVAGRAVPVPDRDQVVPVVPVHRVAEADVRDEHVVPEAAAEELRALPAEHHVGAIARVVDPVRGVEQATEVERVGLRLGKESGPVRAVDGAERLPRGVERFLARLVTLVTLEPSALTT